MESPSLTTPLKDFGRLLRLIFKGLRYASFAFILVTLLVVGRETATAWSWCRALHPALGWLFLLLLGVALAWFVVRPALRFWRLPPALKPPRLPREGKKSQKFLAVRADFVQRYLEGLARHPELQAQAGQIAAAWEEAARLRRRLGRGAFQEPAVALAALEQLERKHLEPLLKPLDEEANRIIRAEALAVGVGTAISANGTVDAFIVLWRTANLVTRVARIYYGRPGIRGSLLILRDVATAMFLATQMQGVTETVGGLLGGWLGKAGSFLAGPAADGALNALATVRIGYVAKARCRSYRPWSDAGLSEILKSTMKEVAIQGRAVVQEVLAAVIKGGLIKLPAHLARKAGGILGGWFANGRREGSGLEEM